MPDVIAFGGRQRNGSGEAAIQRRGLACCAAFGKGLKSCATACDRNRIASAGQGAKARRWQVGGRQARAVGGGGCGRDRSRGF